MADFYGIHVGKIYHDFPWIRNGFVAWDCQNTVKTVVFLPCFCFSEFTKHLLVIFTSYINLWLNSDFLWILARSSKTTCYKLRSSRLFFWTGVPTNPCTPHSSLDVVEPPLPIALVDSPHDHTKGKQRPKTITKTNQYGMPSAQPSTCFFLKKSISSKGTHISIPSQG